MTTHSDQGISLRLHKTRAHIARLLDSGMNMSQLGTITGIPPTSLTAIWQADDRWDTKDSEVILAAKPLDLPQPADGWLDHAACKGDPIGRWFPSRGGGSAGKVAELKKVCAGCPVADDCLLAGLGEKYGVWGGTSERQRRKLRAARTAEIRRQIDAQVQTRRQAAA